MLRDVIETIPFDRFYAPEALRMVAGGETTGNGAKSSRTPDGVLDNQ